jgi:hypothetical protein
LNITDSAQLQKGDKTDNFRFSVSAFFESIIGFGATLEVSANVPSILFTCCAPNSFNRIEILFGDKKSRTFF